MVSELKKSDFGVLGIGEVMLRLSPVGKERISYCETFEKRAGGSELNVVSGISMLGIRTGMITKLPKNEIGKFAKHKIRYSGTSDDYVIYDESPEMRLGIYYYESGAYPRVSVVSYDRKASSFTRFKKEELPEKIYSSASIFHTSGITLALGEELRENVIDMMERFHNEGALISFDVNYRAALWDEDTARETIKRVLPFIDILFVSEETSRRMFGMTGTLKDIHKEFSRQYPNLEIIASTKRKVISPQKHTFSSLVYDCKEDTHFEESPYENIDVVDRIGSGDAYVAGALYALLRFGSIEKMAEYGDAMAALKNTVLGDTTQCDITDIERIIKNHNTTGPKNEMVR
ncbi:MAG: sugar kinase [Clostridia bacterium]|nr:sugar kinase [Clostridia bacterium]